MNPPGGCRFHTRCPVAQPRCTSDPPALLPLDDGRRVRCHFPFSLDRRGTDRHDPRMPAIDLTYLNGLDVAALALTDDEILAAVEGGLRAQGLGQTVLEPRVHLVPGELRQGPFQRAARRRRAARRGRRQGRRRLRRQLEAGLPSELAVLTLFDPADRRAARDPRCLGADRHAHRRDVRARRQASRAEGREGAGPHRRARHGVLERPAHRSPVRLRRDPRAFAAAREPRARSPTKLERDLGKPVIVTDDWESCVRGADIVVEASRLPEPQPLLRTEWIKPGALVIPYGTMSAVEITLTDIMAKIVVDDWGQCRKGMPFGALRRARRRGQAARGQPARRAGADRRRPEAGPGARRRDEPVLASRPVALRHRARLRAARQGEAPRASARRCASSELRSRCTRMYDVTPDGARALARAARARGARRGGSDRVHRPRRAGAARRAVGARRSRRRVHVRLSARDALSATSARWRRRSPCSRTTIAPTYRRSGWSVPTALSTRSPRRSATGSAGLAEHSHSGFNAPRHALLAHRTATRPQALSRVDRAAGASARRACGARRRSASMSSPIDAYWWWLLQRHDPAPASGIPRDRGDARRADAAARVRGGLSRRVGAATDRGAARAARGCTSDARTSPRSASGGSPRSRAPTTRRWPNSIARAHAAGYPLPA